MTGRKAGDDRLVILMPVYNDWDALALLIPDLERELKAAALKADLLLVDDGCTTAVPSNFGQSSFASIQSIEVLSLRRNVGHQRAIAVGLSFIEANRPCRAVVVMDSDGEDDPRDVPRLIRECVMHGNQKIIFAARNRRSETLSFQLFYHAYRIIHLLLTGVQVRVGNFSVIPAGALNRLVAVSELWNHYAAAVYKAKLPMALLTTDRSRRLLGESQMSFVALVVHGLSAMAVFGDRIGVRLLTLVSVAMGFLTIALASVIGVRLMTTLAIPGWATYAGGILLIILIQMLIVVLVFAFMILAGRDAMSVIPGRDYVHITGAVRQVYGELR
jgi:polyisoprenyl-phosphate glycosyltransferase